MSRVSLLGRQLRATESEGSLHHGMAWHADPTAYSGMDMPILRHHWQDLDSI
jgi:hypothetical protein